MVSPYIPTYPCMSQASSLEKPKMPSDPQHAWRPQPPLGACPPWQNTEAKIEAAGRAEGYFVGNGFGLTKLEALILGVGFYGTF